LYSKGFILFIICSYEICRFCQVYIGKISSRNDNLIAALDKNKIMVYSDNRFNIH